MEQVISNIAYDESLLYNYNYNIENYKYSYNVLIKI